MGVCIAVVYFAQPALAQQAPLTQDEIAQYIASGVSRDRILALSRNRCLAFVVDERSSQPLLAESGDSALVSGLRGACYVGSALEVAADRPGAAVTVDDRAVGTVPWSGPVRARERITVNVQQGTWSQHVRVDVRRNQYVRVTFHTPADTVLTPSMPSADDLARLAADTASPFRPRTPKPSLPVPPGRGLGLSTIIGGVIGGVGGASLGFGLCKTTTITWAPDPSNPGFNVRSGSHNSTNVGCAAATGGGGLVAGALVGNLIARAQYGSKLRQYEASSAQYPAQLARWQRDYVGDSTATLADRRQRYHDALASIVRARQVRTQNAATLARNANLPGPEITVGPARRLSRAAMSPANP